eukprot:scaffold1021_cov108-Isochrysis_galbana.AAC.16
MRCAPSSAFGGGSSLPALVADLPRRAPPARGAVRSVPRQALTHLGCGATLCDPHARADAPRRPSPVVEMVEVERLAERPRRRLLVQRGSEELDAAAKLGAPPAGGGVVGGRRQRPERFELDAQAQRQGQDGVDGGQLCRKASLEEATRGHLVAKDLVRSAHRVDVGHLWQSRDPHAPLG